MNTSLVHLSRTALATITVLTVVLVIGTAYLFSRTGQHQDEMAEILDLQRRISALSAAGDALLLQGADPELLAAVKQDAREISADLRVLGKDFPDALNGVRAIEHMLRMLDAADAIRARTADATDPQPGALLSVSPLTENMLSTMASHGIALDAAIGAVSEASQKRIAAQSIWQFGAVSGIALVFAAVSFAAFSTLHWRVGVPLNRFADTIRSIEAGKEQTRLSEHRIDELGRVARAFNSLLTRRQAAETSLKKSSALVRLASDVADFGGWRFEQGSNQVEWTGGTAQIHDLPPGSSPSPEEALGYYHEADQKRIRSMVQACLEEGKPFDDTFRLITATGRQLTVRTVGEPEFDGDGRIVAAQGAFQDVSELMQIRETAARRGAQLRDVLAAIGDGFFTMDPDWRFTFINQRAYELVDRAGEDLIGHELWEEFPEARGTRFETVYRRAMSTGESQLFIEYLPSVERWFEVNAHPTPDGLAIYFRDFTVQRETQERLKLFEAATERLNDMIVITEAEAIEAPDHPRMLYVNTAFERITGYTREEVIGKTPRILQGSETDRAALDEIRAALETRSSMRTEVINYTKSGEPYWIEIDVVPLTDDEGHLTHFVAVERDITDRKRAEERIRENENRLKLVSEVTTDFIWDWDIEKDTWTRSEQHLETLGITPEAPASTLDETLLLIHPDDRDRVRREIQDAIAGTGNAWDSEYRVVGRTGEVRQFDVRAAIVRDDAGKATRMVGGVSDVTELRKLDLQVHEAQKLDSIGQLTGGVAHDFNNLLTIILGNADMMLDHAPDETMRQLAASTLEAAERGAHLTDSLLTFARRQPLEPEPTNINDLIENSLTLLRKSVEAGIAIVFELAAESPVSNVDANRLQAAILNLVINSGHAIGERGTIVIETSNQVLDQGYTSQHPGVSPGQYVSIAVTDDGCGMSPDIVENAFDPFFTTRPLGQGTGLGLSSVYGFAKQSGGHARIYSEPGTGTTVRIYLPVAGHDQAIAQQEPDPTDLKGRGEHILVVEDDESLCANVTKQLKGLGYRVSAASNGDEALEILDTSSDIDLVFTDVVMPGRMNGRDLAREVQRNQPDLPFLFTSGYSRHAIVQNGRLEEGLNLLSKPYRLADLARAVRDALSS